MLIAYKVTANILDCWVFNSMLILLSLTKQYMGIIQFTCHLPNKINQLAWKSFIITLTLQNLI